MYSDQWDNYKRTIDYVHNERASTAAQNPAKKACSVNEGETADPLSKKEKKKIKSQQRKIRKKNERSTQQQEDHHTALVHQTNGISTITLNDRPNASQVGPRSECQSRGTSVPVLAKATNVAGPNTVPQNQNIFFLNQNSLAPNAGTSDIERQNVMSYYLSGGLSKQKNTQPRNKGTQNIAVQNTVPHNANSVFPEQKLQVVNKGTTSNVIQKVIPQNVDHVLTKQNVQMLNASASNTGIPNTVNHNAKPALTKQNVVSPNQNDVSHNAKLGGNKIQSPGNSNHKLNTAIDRAPHSLSQVKTGSSNAPDSFESLQPLVMPATMTAIRKLHYPTMREIQARTIPKLLQGKNVRGTAATGSGKTLAFLIPAVDRLRRLGFSKEQGVGVLILSPTRELAMQIMSVLNKFLAPPYNAKPDLTHAIIMGGTGMNREKLMLMQGVNILVATPGRLMDHLHNTHFRYDSLSCLVIDEADMILSTGFEPQMKQILAKLPTQRQTMLFSATRGGKVEVLVKDALGSQYEEVDITVNKVAKLNHNVAQEYVVCPTFQRFLVMYALLEQHRSGKVMVFFSICKSVKLYTAILNKLGMKAECIHGRMSQNKRSSTFLQFQSSPSMLLLCTDVAARGWDIPQVDLILQVDPPTDASEFAHRVGRAAREENAVGRAVLLLRPEELSYLHHLKQQHGTILREHRFTQDSLPHLQHKVYMAVQNDRELTVLAKKCSRVYMKGYSQLKPSQCFNQKSLSSIEIDVSYGVLVELPPHVAQQTLLKAEQFASQYRATPASAVQAADPRATQNRF